MKPYHTEACITSLEEGLHAERSGADRVEVCSRLETEGMTPEVELVRDLCENLKIPVRVMIRETEDGYAADDYTVAHMKDHISVLKQLPIDGFVFGLLKGGAIDEKAMEALLHEAYPLPVTFHKAFDAIKDPDPAIRWLNGHSQIDCILTSGNAVQAIDGIDTILQTMQSYRGQTMPGGKITYQNVDALHQHLNASWYHGRKIV